jgi:PAS domain S-box-containing protein
MSLMRIRCGFSMRLDGRNGMRGIVDSSSFLQPANAMEFVDTILEASTEYSIVGQGLDGTILLWSSGAKRLYGYQREEIVGKANAELLHTPEDVAEGLPHQMRQQALTGGKWEGTVTRVRRDGSRFTARVVITPWRNQQGEPVGFLLISKDVSKEIADAIDHQRAEAALRASEQRFRELLESAPDAMVIVDPKGHITLVNRQAERLFGYQREELLSQPIERLVPERFHARHRQHRDGYLAQPGARPMGAGLQLYARRKDGSEFPVEISLSPLQTDQGTVVSAAVRDVTDRKQAEETLRERDATLGALLAASPDIITMLGPNGQHSPPNPAVRDILGYDLEAYERMDRLPLVHPDDRERTVQAFASLLQGGPPMQLRYRMSHAEGRWVSLETHARTMTDAHGRPSGAVAITRDITERIALEQALIRAKEEAERANQAKSEYLSRMSHELRTPLNAILGFAQLLEMDELNNEQRDSLGHILSGARHLLALINEVLDIAAIEAGRLSLSLESLAVADVAAEAVGLIRPLADQHHILLASPERPCDEHVLGDRQRLKQVLLNLLSNAVKYNRAGGSVHLSWEPVAGGRLQIKVTDTGLGIPPEALERLFVPFDRLGSERTAVEGSGLGLPLTKRLAEAMGGTLGLATTVGQGSTFWVELPLAEVSVQHLRRNEPLPPQGRPAGEPPALTVLYIEDDPSNLQLVERVLRRRPGVRLISAMRPQLGLDLAGQYHPDLVLLDLDLPDMSGEDVLRRLRADPSTAQVRVVILSGADAGPGLFTRLLDKGVRTFLTKPLDAKALLAVLDTVAAEQERAGSRSRSS